jgi:hypothetical protein
MHPDRSSSSSARARVTYLRAYIMNRCLSALSTPRARTIARMLAES